MPEVREVRLCLYTSYYTGDAFLALSFFLPRCSIPVRHFLSVKRYNCCCGCESSSRGGGLLCCGFFSSRGSTVVFSDDVVVPGILYTRLFVFSFSLSSTVYIYMYIALITPPAEQDNYAKFRMIDFFVACSSIRGRYIAGHEDVHVDREINPLSKR